MVTGGKLRERKTDRCSGGRMDPQGALPRPKKVFKWEDKPRLLREILSTGHLPFVAKYHEGDLTKYIKTWRRPVTDGEDSRLIKWSSVERWCGTGSPASTWRPTRGLRSGPL